MEGKKQIDFKKDFGHYATKYKSLNPFNEIDSKKLLKDRLKQNLEDAKPIDEEEESKTVTIDFIKQVPQLEDVELTKSDSLCNIPKLSEKEAVRRVRNKFIKLQLLYAQEYRYLLFKYRVKRREYLLNKKRDLETYGLLGKSKWSNEEEYSKLRKLKLLEHYQKMSIGQEAVVFKTAMDRKIRATALLGNKGKAYHPHCSFVEMGIKCTGKMLPKSKFCRKHILKDPKQVLFRACGILQSDNKCQEPIVDFDGKLTCVLHEKLPMLRD
ncbi:KAT8 regulatory NSL complex subunit 2 [Daktulosphaira vitifoliae]|uniref:KAT8 regulatory NSL complex subunit 2 n=1 Tax=Daktulosphaira vitifoliae TaxID=58002 RepID=UPI0021AA1DBB|nr:KAT8 regulatory NSL complex subunit 2 [Daktulosphaira vitifoliae]